MLTTEQKQQFEETGYLVLQRLVHGELLKDIQRESNALIAAEPAESSHRVWHERVLFRRKAFRDVLDLEPLISAERDLLGEDVQLLAIDLLVVRPGQGEVGWHRDVSFVCNKTLSINTGIYLTDMTEKMGPLRVLPGSHRRDNPPTERGADPLPRSAFLYPPGVRCFSMPLYGILVTGTPRMLIEWGYLHTSAITG
jgi:ectoine hydroxylase-related dioxygenase (phytanoyl-CoA dioxygenase family)